MSRRRPRSNQTDRRGVLVPLVAVALVVVLGCTALVLDRLWLDGVRLELRVAAEAAALAAAGEMAGDELLERDPDLEQCVCRARTAAQKIAAVNVAAGSPVVLDPSATGDIRFGRLVESGRTGVIQFLESEDEPRSILVMARRMRSRNNPVALFLCGATGTCAADVEAWAEATLDNHVVGLRPFSGVAIPALPLAILKADGTGQRAAWDAQIEAEMGGDAYSFNAERGEVEDGGDGIPEIILKSRTNSGDPDEINIRLLTFGSRSAAQQIRDGWRAEDLSEFGGELRLDGDPVAMDGTSKIGDEAGQALKRVIGQKRIVLLYDDVAGTALPGSVNCVAAVAGRVMAVRAVDGGYELTFQPSVLATRTAVLGAESADENRYLYKVHLTQ